MTDRQRRAFFLRILPYKAKGAIAGVVVTLIDVSSLKAAEDALFHERYLLNSLLATVPDAIYFRDGNGRFILANPAMAERLGLASPEQAVGKTPAELADGAFVIFHLAADGRLLAASGIGRGNAVAKDIRLAEMMIAKGAHPDPAALADPSVNLKRLL